ncbi:MAG: aminotransferase class V-fold PLP-dependent enzyme [Candidatus Ruminococcus intestinipullorum]|nr:aminotransferase class V-fold PLP-dependent enzyme [Candidatus Ruminococcus intestinipullorum]
MLSFMNDYSEGACVEILKLLEDTNTMQHAGYGMDSICEEAKAYIKKELENELAEIHFLTGGTQTNKTVIAAALRPYEAVIAVDTGHIHVHETGAIENSGHKVITVKGVAGKMLPEAIDKVVEEHTDEHMVKPAMVYISNSTELGTIYTKQELEAISRKCKEHGLILFLDGARLGSALMACDNDIKMRDLAQLCDIFYIGGTKNGALLGEAVIILQDRLKENFRYYIKQNGGMLAKGWILGIQFLGLFQEGAFYRLAEHANRCADILRKGLKELGIPMLVETTTNQIFPIFSNELLEDLEKEVKMSIWERVDRESTAVRMVTSWNTKEEDVEKLLFLLEDLRLQKEKS